jgi:hypothetical protein
MACFMKILKSGGLRESWLGITECWSGGLGANGINPKLRRAGIEMNRHSLTGRTEGEINSVQSARPLAG